MPSKRVRFALQKDSFCNLKGALLKAKRTPFQIRSLQVAKTVITSGANRHYQCLNSSIFTRTPIPSKRQLRCATNQPSEKALVENP